MPEEQQRLIMELWIKANMRYLVEDQRMFDLAQRIEVEKEITISLLKDVIAEHNARSDSKG